jgi:hypothetical protein
MTTTDQDAQAERLIEWLARQVRKICPPSLLADEHAWSRRIVTAMREEHWKCVIPSPTVITARREGDPPTKEFLAAKAAITRKEDPNG